MKYMYFNADKDIIPWQMADWTTKNNIFLQWNLCFEISVAGDDSVKK